METTFYDDNQFRSANDKYDGKSTKRPATLDLDSPGTMSKKQRFTALLTSPDLNMLKLASPELERFIIANSGNITTTPTPTQFLFPKNVTEEQEQYARGFVDALNQLHQTSLEVSNNLFSKEATPVNTTASTAALSKLYSGLLPFYIQPATTSVIKSSGNVKNPPITNSFSTISTIRPPSVENTSSNSCQSNSMPLTLDLAVKEEFQTVPTDFSSPPLSPIYKSIDMADQERIKLERKRHRNRIAASKCRKRKLEKISRLEEKVKELKNENSELGAIADKLRDQVCNLKQQVLEHVKNGCQIMMVHGL